MSERRRPQLAYVVASPTTARVLLRGQLARMREWGFDVTVLTAPGRDLDVVGEREGVRTIGVGIERDIRPGRDLRAVVALVDAIRRLRPDIVNASNPKGGLLGLLAARAIDVPVRIYLLRGLRLETTHGLTRGILGATERIAAACAHRVVCVSESLRRTFVGGGFAKADRTLVLGAGSSNGIEVERFEITPSRRAEAAALRARHGIPPGARVIGFIGRPVADKGIDALLDAFTTLSRSHLDLFLMLVGEGFSGEVRDRAMTERMAALPRVVMIGAVDEPAPYYAAMDVLAFPSHREGFPNVPLEAAVAGVPTAGFAATGVVDAVRDGETGLLVPIGDVEGLIRALARYLAEPELARAHGAAARDRAVREFARETVWRRWGELYVDLLRARGRPLPAGW